jgi:putative membrane protein
MGKLNIMNDKAIFRIIMGISIFVFVVVVLLNRKVIPVTIPTPSFVYLFPKFNAIINGTCSVLLLTSLYFIKQKNIMMHKRINILTFLLSSVFLIFYIVYHYFAPETKFGDLDHNGILSAQENLSAGKLRYVYYVILSSHIILAAMVLPLILLSFQKGLQLQVEKHRKLVRWSFPIWLYVTITGVVVYLMISPYYPFN